MRQNFSGTDRKERKGKLVSKNLDWIVISHRLANINIIIKIAIDIKDQHLFLFEKLLKILSGQRIVAFYKASYGRSEWAIRYEGFLQAVWRFSSRKR
jgi:hypothetical protein